MSIQKLLSDLTEFGIKLALRDNNQLSVSAPKGMLTDEVMTRIRERKADLIERLKQNKEAVLPQALPVIAPDPTNLYEPFPLGDLQTAFLMGDGEDMEYHVRPHYYLEDEFVGLDPERFEWALNEALYRQRANLVVVTDDAQLQTVRHFTPVKVEVQDLRGLPNVEVTRVLQKTREAMSRQVLPLDRWPWIQCSLSLYEKDKVRLHYNNNNFFSDGWGTKKLLGDVLHYVERPDAPLPPITLSYRDCILGLAKLEESWQGEASKRYWLDRLPTMPGPPSVPLKAGVNPRQRSRLVRREKVVPPHVWKAFKEAAGHYELTPTNALFAIYSEVLASWSGSRHFLLNNMVTHRLPIHPEVKDIIGNFASLYPLEVDWREQKPFYERARKLQEQITTDLQNVYWSGVKVLQALNQFWKTPGRAACPFVVGSGLFMNPLEKPQVGNLETPQVLLDNQFWELGDGGLWIVWDLIEQCFPDGMIDAMWDAHYSLLKRLAENRSAWREVNIDLLPSNQHSVRALANNTGSMLPRELLHHGLRRSAERFPDRLAVISATGSLTFSQMSVCANQLAHWLHSEGAEPGEAIAVILDKGWEQVAAVFGILNSGGVYVPLDPAWPEARIQVLLEQIQAKRVLTSSSITSTLNLSPDIQALCLDNEEWRQYSDSPLPPLRQPKDLAYIIFTSGSTGAPKGVMISHQGALNTIVDINGRFGISEDDVLLGVSALYFDLSVYDLFGSAAVGATLVLPPVSDSPNPAAWIDCINVHNVTAWNSAPALMQLLLDAAQTAGVSLPSLRTVMLSGDWIPVPMPRQIKETASNATVISLGGATEASIWSIYYPINDYDPAWTSIPYGRPLANQSWRILHDDWRDAPDWVPGNLYIGGDGLAIGYWRDEEKTANAFVSHPITGERLYRTGDLGRYLPDGNIEFLGRADFQVKIQGYRVELGEIEAVLSQHPEVIAAAAIMSATPIGKQLIAFAVPSSGRTPKSEDLMSFLRAKLPAYMAPAHITLLERLPLTSNGKVDRVALAKLGLYGKEKRQFVAPRTEIEKKLASIWEQVLAVQPIGLYDDFFELGGQSFVAVRMMTRIAHEYGQRLPLSVLLQDRTIEALARTLEKRELWSPLVPLRLTGAGSACFFVHPAGGNVLCYRLLAERLGRPFYGLQAPGLFGEGLSFSTIEELAALYVKEIRKAQSKGPYFLGGWSSGGMIAFEIARQLEGMGEHVQHVALIDTPAPLHHAPIDRRALLYWFLEDLNIGFDSTLALESEVAAEGDRSPVEIIDLMCKHQGIAHNLELLQLGHVFSVFSSIVLAGREYRPPMIKANLSVLRANEGRVSEFADHPAHEEADWGWAKFTQGEVYCAQTPGAHHTLLDEKNIDALVAVLKKSYG